MILLSVESMLLPYQLDFCLKLLNELFYNAFNMSCFTERMPPFIHQDLYSIDAIIKNLYAVNARVFL